MFRTADGAVSVESERHVEGIFGRAQWLQWLGETGLPAYRDSDPWGRDVFVGSPP